MMPHNFNTFSYILLKHLFLLIHQHTVHCARCQKDTNRRQLRQAANSNLQVSKRQAAFLSQLWT